MTPFAAQLPALQVVVPLFTAALIPLLRERSLAWAAATAASVCSFAIATLVTAGCALWNVGLGFVLGWLVLIALRRGWVRL